VLDAVGDLYLAGAPLIGHFRGARSGHALNRQLLEALLTDESAWCVTTVARGDAIADAAWEAPPRRVRA
jgi:UDP-3-O-[3-hydroxymyristoyl] N-acetylglucosamine deacetylase